MPADYSTAQLLTDVMNVIKDLMPSLIPVAIILGAANWVIMGFIQTIFNFGKRTWK